jgi:serine/threonine-protein kinase
MLNETSEKQSGIGAIKRYEIRKLIGQGAMADVYEAYDPRIDRLLAIKVLREDRSVDNEYIMRFMREAKAVGNLSHPHIVTIYDVDEFEKRPYLVMELLDGTPLNKVIKSGKKYSLNEALSIGAQLGSALHYAHGRGVVHRDIKPSNIICDDSTNTIKITDFGIAHFEDTELTHQTRMGDVIGTPQYMSPEQVSGAKVDGRSDLFSVGVILYQLITGQKPFGGDSVASLMYQITHTEPKPLQQLDPELPTQVRRIIEKLLKKNPNERFQTGQELVNAITLALRELEDSTGKKARQRIVPIRIKWSVLMASIVSLAMIASIVMIIHKQFQAMTNQMYEYGDSLVKFVAAESAVPVLSEDWISIELFVKEASERQKFDHLTIADHRGIIRGSTDPQDIGQTYVPKNDIVNSDGVNVNMVKLYQRVFKNEGKVSNFEAPILFQKKKIGSVHLGISQESLEKLAELTVYMMVTLLIVTISVVVIFSYALGRYFSAAITVVRKAIEDVRDGHMDRRISQKRNDEFGQLYSSFNDMADALQKRDIHMKFSHMASKNENQESTKVASHFSGK